MQRNYQYDYADNSPAMYDRQSRERKAATMLAVFEDYFDKNLSTLNLLNVGGSAGIIDNYLAKYFEHVTSIDIDEGAIAHAQSQQTAENLTIELGDALNLGYPEESFDVVICSHVYEHVVDPVKMLAEIRRVLKPGGVCYFAAGNRLCWMEPHYKLPLLSAVPRPLAHLYIRLSGKARFYHEKHLSYWGLIQLIKPFKHLDYTKKLINNPEKFKTEYMLPPGSFKQRVAISFSRWSHWLTPSYIFLLIKN